MTVRLTRNEVEQLIVGVLKGTAPETEIRWIDVEENSSVDWTHMEFEANVEEVLVA